MRVLVCGGRGFADTDAMTAALGPLHPEIVIHGGASGADALAGAWAAGRNVPCMVFPAHWVQGRSAGPRRNAWMVTYGKPDLVVAFPGGRGTENMVRTARAAGVEVRRVVP